MNNLLLNEERSVGVLRSERSKDSEEVIVGNLSDSQILKFYINSPELIIFLLI